MVSLKGLVPIISFWADTFFPSTFPLITIIIISGKGADSNEKEKKGHSEDLKKTKLN